MKGSKQKGYKKQHFVPQCYLKPWCDPNTPPNQTPYVWQFNKDGAEVKRKSPENIFYETDMYTIVKADGNRDLTLEHGLNELEREFSKIREGKLKNRKGLIDEEILHLCAFVAAMDARTKARRDHSAKEWGKVLDNMNKLKEEMEKNPQSQRKRIELPPTGEILSHEEVREVAANPIQNLLAPTISELTPLLFQLDIAFIENNDPTGFITTDNPCIWFDPEAYKRPPIYRAPALIYKSTEIRMPISPKQMIVFNQKGLNGYINIKPGGVDEINRITRFHAHEYFIVNTNVRKDIWFEPGVEPDDSWEKLHPRPDLCQEE